MWIYCIFFFTIRLRDEQNENRDRHYIENYNYLKRDFENRPDGAGPNFGPFHYGSLYSNPGIVLHFLVRLPPFTKLLMDYQVIPQNRTVPFLCYQFKVAAPFSGPEL